MAIREQMAFSEHGLAVALQALRQSAAEGFIISTCNRVEIYGLLPLGDQGRTLRQFLADQHGLPLEELAPHLYTLVGDNAVRHLFRVAAGLDSMALGEDQIMSQIKATFTAAQSADALGPMTHRLIQAALATGKLVRSDTQLARAQLSVVSVALYLARQTLHSFCNQNVVIVGAGRTAELALKHLKSEPTRSVTVVGRTFERAVLLAERYGVQAAPASDLECVLTSSDLVISCTSAADVIISTALATTIHSARASRPWMLLDLAVPRDIERRVGALPNVHLHDVDDMQAICDANRTARAAEVSSAEAIVEAEVAKWMAWWAAQEVLPTIRALRAHAESIRTIELERALARLNLTSQQEQAVAALTSAIVNKLLHHPTAALKTTSGADQLAQATKLLFSLER
ncbi:MAG: glutamyl-tRNA reductase [Herpetosiphonaceae bacterium]|nr:glutamyl-tRNA reductase [Herpetosiphonaceae bacterium]